MGYAARHRNAMQCNAGTLNVAMRGGMKGEDALAALARCFFKPKQPEALYWIMH